MKFKEDYMQDEYASRHPLLIQMAKDFEEASMAYGIEPVVTRILGVVRGDSGVHADGRAIDFRSFWSDGRLYTEEQIDELLNDVNAKYPRNDGHSTLIHHSFLGAPYHFHLQMSWNPKVYPLDIQAKYFNLNT